jgi:alpha-ketoglutarate-dependent taurine dioxygenase
MGAMMRFRKLGGALGAEVTGLNLQTPLGRCEADQLTKEWFRHGVLVFRGQMITDEEHVRFARRFGRLETFTQPNGIASLFPRSFARPTRTSQGGYCRPTMSESKCYG